MNSRSSSDSLDLESLRAGPTKEEVMLVEAEAKDFYRKHCAEDEINRQARLHCQYVPHSGQSASFFKNIIPAWLSPVAEKSHIIWMHPSADAGLPHTRPGMLVCMPMYFPKNRLGGTLAHELVHCWQRMVPGMWKGIYAKQGWRPAHSDEIQKVPEDLMLRVRINPDTIMSGPFWVWKERYLPLAVFERTDKPSLKETNVRWFDLKNGYAYRSPPLDFQDFFGPVGDPEHPAEVAAYSLAEPGIFGKYPAWETLSYLTRS